jgi:hypothetical protein
MYMSTSIHLAIFFVNEIYYLFVAYTKKDKSGDQKQVFIFFRASILSFCVL